MKRTRVRRIANAHPGAQVEIFFGNLRSKADCARAVDGVSLLFHLAAGLKGAAAELFADSVVVSRNLIEALEEDDDIQTVWGNEHIPDEELANLA